MIVSVPQLLVRTQPQLAQQALYSAAAFASGAVVAPFSACAVYREPSRFTLQRDAQEHMLISPEPLRLVNHACDPNVFFDVDQGALVAIAAIAPGDELRYFYPSTEWCMAEPFPCRCGSPRCLGTIRGAADLPAAVLGRYRLSSFIQRSLAARP